MSKRFLTVLFFIIAVLDFSSVDAQIDTVPKAPVYRVGIFAPLYLDSVFNNNTFRYKQGVPKFIVPAVEFVQGAQIALDSLQAGSDLIEATIYDSKSYTQNVPYLIQNKKLDSLQLIIGSVKDAEYLQLAAFASQRKIPFISVSYPNVTAISANPFLVVMNPTLKSHCEAIYSYILQNHGTENIWLCRQKGTQEDMVASYFKQLNERDGKPLLEINTLTFDSSITAAKLKAKLDSNSNNVIIGGSLDETFAGNIAAACNSLHKTYPITLIGMPTWDGFNALYKFPEFPIYYTSPYHNDKTDEFSKTLIAAYQKKYKGKPTDMAYKGFEAVYSFTKLMAMYPGDLMNHINDKSVKVFCDYNFRPVMLKKESSIPDYTENKHLYFIKILNGSISKAW
jgi:ABC-type branched-subunit amino acid transport system substrate-binding protein